MAQKTYFRFFQSFVFTLSLLLSIFLFSSFSEPRPFITPLFDENQGAKLAVQYEGRIMPFNVAAQVWLGQVSGRDYIKPSKISSFKAADAEDFLWKVMLYGPSSWGNTHLFLVSSSLRKELNLYESRKRFSYFEIKNAIETHVMENNCEFDQLKASLQLFEKPPIYFLPLRFPQGTFAPLSKLLDANSINTTLYSDEDFEIIKSTFFQLKTAISNNQEILSATLSKTFISYLNDQYLKLIINNRLTNQEFASMNQLWAENLLFKYQIFDYTLLAYGSSILIFILYFLTKKRALWKIATIIFLLSLFLNALFLILTTYILQRPPLASMQDTYLFIPFILSLAGIILYLLYKNKVLLPLAAICSSLLLLSGYQGELSMPLQTIQPVLNSNFWLSTHVFLVVSSYAFFLLGGALGTLHQLFFLFNKEIKKIDPIILVILWIGLIFLISGTILGGVWAAESWGRFWDWDPKESFAFITIILYLIIIHAYKYRLIGSYGLSFCSILGLIATIFTWYGVNYILATGLHSYGFGCHNNRYFWSLLIAEGLILSVSLIKYMTTKNAKLTRK